MRHAPVLVLAAGMLVAGCAPKALPPVAFPVRRGRSTT